MALNLTPDYFEADRKYRQAQTPEEKLAALEEMLRTIPKHKASEKKQSDLKRRISEMRQASQTRKKAGATVDPYHIVPQGAGQALLLGLPNSGKSSIVGRLTKAPVKITDFPFGTALPAPGMAHHENVPIELVDLPPVTPEHVPGPLVNAIRNTHVLLLVVDLTSASVLEDLETLLGLLSERGMALDHEPGEEDEADHEDLRVGPTTLIICTKADLPGAMETFATLKELRPGQPEMLAVSSETGEGLDTMMRRLFDILKVIRVYAKEPGKPPDKAQPFILPIGSTVGELARMIHKDLAAHLRYARIWGEQTYAGQQVHDRYVLHDRDTVELHA